jgi:hypothetical protein
MKRREFLVKGGSVLLILPAGWAVTSCDDSSNDNTIPPNTTDAGSNGSGGAATPASTGTGGSGGAAPAPAGGTGGTAGSAHLTFTSSVVAGHSHQFDVDMAVLQQPLSAGLSGNTTVADGHVHTVELSVAELGQIVAGQVVTKETSLANSHTHTFQFHR